jgi:DNA-binding MarR family transcriptional regulator
MMDMIIKLKGCCEREEQEIISSLELKPSEYRTLALMKPDHAYTNDQLSRETGLSKSRGCRVFEKLLLKGYLIRRENDEDKRSFLYQLTRSGEEIKEKITNLKRSCERKILSKVNASDRDKIREGLLLLINIMEVKRK